MFIICMLLLQWPVWVCVTFLFCGVGCSVLSSLEMVAFIISYIVHLMLTAFLHADLINVSYLTACTFIRSS